MPTTKNHLHVVASLLFVATSLFAVAVAHATAMPENGDVYIGRNATGPDLDAAVLPSQPLLVTVDSPYQAFSNTGTLIHVAAWTAWGTPAADANVYFSNELVGRTDETGTLVFRWGVPGDAGIWSRGGEIAVRWEMDDVLYGGAVSFNAFPRTSSFSSDHVYVYTDRGTYNPGDMIRIRALGWNLREDYSPLDGAEIEFLLTAPDGRVVGGGTAETNALGVTALDIAVSEHAEEGVYELRASYEDASTRARLRIRQFTPPLIKIEHSLGRFLTFQQDALDFDVTLGYFTDAAFVSGTLVVELLVDGTSRYRQETELTGAGPHHVSIGEETLDAVRRGLSDGESVEVELTVTDQHGRSDDLLRELRYTRNPYIVVIEKDRDYYSPGDPVELIVRIADLDRVPVRNTEVTALISGEDSMTVTTDDDGTAQFSLEMPDRELEVEILLADVGNAVATARIPLQGSQPMRSHIADAVVHEDEMAHLVVTFPSRFVPVETVVHIDVVDFSGSLVQSVLLPVHEEDGSYIAEGDFASPSWGSMLLTLFVLGRDTAGPTTIPPMYSALGLMTEGQNLAVHPNRELQIHLDGIPDHLSPGEEFSGTITVTNPRGEVVDAAIGAAIVDAAVLSLGSPLEITPMDYFYNPQLRVISTTGSAILTWPVVSRNWGPNQNDIALPPFPYGPGGQVAGLYAAAGKAEHSVGSEHEEGSGYGFAADDPFGVGGYGAERPLGELAQATANVTIRTEFPETSLWAPFMEALDGSAELSGVMPDAITTQEIAIVASDANGGVGVLRVPVQVTQPLFVQADLPDRLTVGDQLEARALVQNLTDEAQTVTVSFESDSLEAERDSVRVEVPARGVAVAMFPIHAVHPGPTEYRVTATGPGFSDSENREIWVRPFGAPDVAAQVADLHGGEALILTTTLPEDGQMSTLSLNVGFPALSAAFAGLDAIREELSGDDTMSVSGELIATALIYRMQRDHGGTYDTMKSLRQHLEWGLYELLTYQGPDGGWGFWWDRDSNPYITAYCLEALVELENAGLTVPTVAYRRAFAFLEQALAEDGLYDMSAIAFWEGNTDQVREGLTAEIFDILTSVPRAARDAAWRRTIEELAPHFVAYLYTETPDPMTLAHAALGLHRALAADVIEIEGEQLTWAAQRLMDVRRLSHWEPSWFNAYGGTIEATVVALQLYSELDRDELLAAEEREAVRYLLSTRDEWGGWHNPRGTAAAIRGLAILEPGGEEIPSTVTIRIDGEEIVSIPIDPADPFMSAIRLRDYDLTRFVDSGVEHAISIEYDGALEPEVRLVTRHWRAAEELSSGHINVTPQLSESRTTMDQVVYYSLQVESLSAEAQVVQIELAAPANAEIDEQSLAGLREAGLIEGFEQLADGYRLTLEVDERAQRELNIRLVTNRAGEASVPPVRILTLGAPVSEPVAVAALPMPLVVE